MTGRQERSARNCAPAWPGEDNQKKITHIFDVDHTVIRSSTTWYFIREALDKGLVSLSQLRKLPFEWLAYKLGRISQDFIEDAVESLAGIEKFELERIASSSFSRLRPNIYRDAVSLIRGARDRGEEVIFATSSFHILIKPLEQFLGIHESIASALEFRDNKTTGKLTGYSLFGAKKKDAVTAWLEDHAIDRQDVRFYSDSYSDIPLLEFCGQPVAVNPDHILKRAAKSRGWQILYFKETLGK